MKGTVYKRRLRSGRIFWEVQLDVGRDEHGKRVRISGGYFARKGEAELERARLLQEHHEGFLIKPSPKTLGEFLEEWFREHAERRCAPKTVERYRQLAAYVLPHIYNVRLHDLSALMLERLFHRLKDAGGRNRKTKARRPLSAKTVRHVAGLIHVALDTALRWKLLKVNPMDGVQLPKVKKREAEALDPAQLTWYLDAARADDVMYEILLLASATGCRRGELLALMWPDLDLVNRVMRVNKSLEQTKAGLTPKGTKNEEGRIIFLPPSVVEVLKQHRLKQDEHRRAFGKDYRTDLDLVFCTPDGNYLKPDSVTAKACLIARKAGLKHVSLHSLRHSHGSILLSAGVPPPTVSKRLGHSSVYVTATIYSHAPTEDEIAAAYVWDTVFTQANQRQISKQ